MIVDLTEIEGLSRTYDFKIPVGELELDSPGVRLASDVEVHSEVIKHAVEVNANGSITAEAEIDCTRCLEPVRQKLAIDFATSFVDPEHFASGRDHEISTRDLDTDVLEGHRLDLAEIVREQIVLNLPEQFFCTPDCKGICPKCGANRNLIDCKCELNESDPRWDALKSLK